MKPKSIKQFHGYVDGASTILILQPDKPDGDSVASALALEEIFSDLGKEIHHFTAGRVEQYLSHLPGWDRIDGEWPARYDIAILIDAGSDEQVPRLLEGHKKDLIAKPYLLLDHHPSSGGLSHLAAEIIDESAAATGELIFRLAKQLKWSVNPQACRLLISSILADTLNLTNSKTTVQTVATFAEIVATGEVDLHDLNVKWRESSAYDPDLIQLKGRLLSSMELYADGQIALIGASKELLDEYRQRTNLAALVFFDMLNARGIKLAIFVNDYNTMIRVAMRAKTPVAGLIAKHFGGGGHDMAAAFPCTDKTVAELKPELITYAARLLNDDQAIQ